MLLTETGFALVEHLERQKDVPSLLISFQRLIQTFGMNYYCVGDASRVKREGRRWGGTMPERWHYLYARRNHLSKDMGIARASKQSTPFRWSDAFAGADDSARQVLNDANEFGLRDGLMVPIHLPDGSVHGVSIATANYDLSPQDERALHMASLYLHARMTVLRAPASPPPAHNLTPRERECLQWVAAGKTDWEISQILSISEQTVHGYVQNAMTKLSARTRAQAVATAMLSRQIQL
jgi:LuxR family transcriptional regulator, quorum-sensing system regulator BjaR1